jgi:hypothetical protein
LKINAKSSIGQRTASLSDAGWPPQVDLLNVSRTAKTDDWSQVTIKKIS